MLANFPLWRFRVVTLVLVASASVTVMVPTPAHAAGLTYPEPAGPSLTRVEVGSTSGPYVSAPLRVASYNVRCSVCRIVGNPEEASWQDRRASVVKTIRTAAPDVIGLQEASSALLRNKKGKRTDTTQFENLVEGLGKPYAAVSFARSNCVVPPREAPCEYYYRGASRHTKIVYNSDRLKLTASGTRELARATDHSDHYVAWAIFRQKSTKTSFFFVDTHLHAGIDAGKSTVWADQRRKEARDVATALTELNVQKLPVVLVGDMNSTRTEAKGRNPYDVFTRAGLVDPLTAPAGKGAERKVGTEYATYNGFVRKPVKQRGLMVKAGVDYVLTTPMRVSDLENVVQLDSKGRIRGTIPSDHNLLRADVWLPRPTPSP